MMKPLAVRITDFHLHAFGKEDVCKTWHFFCLDDSCVEDDSCDSDEVSCIDDACDQSEVFLHDEDCGKYYLERKWMILSSS